jgi:hypothetical protein
MSIDRSLFAKLDFLITQGVSKRAHSGANLLAHLRGTRNLLVLWKAHPALCDAGLFHSVYGTESFHDVVLTIDQRNRVRGVISAEAEEIAYLYGAMSKETFYANMDRCNQFSVFDRFSRKWVQINKARFHDLCNLDAANLLEQWPRFPPEMQLGARNEFQKMLPLLLPDARIAVCAAYGFT